LHVKFLIYTAVSILILSAFLGLTWLSGSSSFDYQPLLANSPLRTAILALGALLVGFGIKIPWFPSTPGAHVIIDPGFSTRLGVAEVGNLWVAAVWFRFVSEAWAALAPTLANWAVSVLYGALWRSQDMKKWLPLNWSHGLCTVAAPPPRL